MNLYTKIEKRIWSEIVRKFRAKSFYSIIYKSFWHSKYHKPITTKTHQNYLTAVPNQGAGIGHQMANWIAGYWFSHQFNLKFAHIPFSSEKWDQFLGFGKNEVLANDLIQKKNFKKVLLPLFNEYDETEVTLIKKIIDSYNNQKVLFVAEQDQGYRDQFGNIETLREKFYTAKSRKEESLMFNKDHFNIAIHVRRGDIVIGQENNNPNLRMRWQDNNYFEKVLTKVLATLKTNKKNEIYLFSQSKREDFPEFEKYENFHFCMDMSAQDSFLHMVNADLLITSKSSFSYKPALLNKGIKVCPENFWHGYPNTPDWVLANDLGELELKQLIKVNE